VLLIGLTGGIGSGKSSVAARLRDHGVQVLDADRLARDVVARGTPGLAAVAERFGPEVLAADGSLDRAALASRVFEDPQARRDLEAITHPRIRELFAARLAELPDDAVVAHDVPLLVELGYAPGYHLVVIVGASEETRVARLVEHRGMAEADARARVRAQADDAARREVADVWLDNEGTPEDLRSAVDRLVTTRLEPFHRNLLAGRPVAPGEELAPDPGEDVSSRPRRVQGRLAHVVRDAEVTARAVPGDPTRVEAAVTAPRGRRDDILAALARAGFVPSGPDTVASCDPGRPASVALRWV
jgi:dephospho-CoA kinase